jgi:hypothetical protein
MAVVVAADGEAREHARDHDGRSLAPGLRRRLETLVAGFGQTRIRRDHLAARHAREPAGVAQIGDVELRLLRHRRGRSTGFGVTGEDRACAIGSAKGAGVFLGPGNRIAPAANHGVERQRIFWSIHVAPIFELWPSAAREQVTTSGCPKQTEIRLAPRAGNLAMPHAPGLLTVVGSLIFRHLYECLLRDCAHSRNDRSRENARQVGFSLRSLQLRQTFCATRDACPLDVPYRTDDYHDASRTAILMRSGSAGQKMRVGRFDVAAWTVAFWLPAFMGAVEYVLRIAFAQPAEDSFFPISLVASGISQSVMSAMVPRDVLSTWDDWQLAERFDRIVQNVNLGVFASLAGVLLWIYLLLASFNEAVRTILPMHPFLESLAYYALCVYLTSCRGRALKC